jgi:hypothetical protein
MINHFPLLDIFTAIGTIDESRAVLFEVESLELRVESYGVACGDII